MPMYRQRRADDAGSVHCPMTQAEADAKVYDWSQSKHFFQEVRTCMAALVRSGAVQSKNDMPDLDVAYALAIKTIGWEPAGRITVPDYIEGIAKGTVRVLPDGGIFRKR